VVEAVKGVWGGDRVGVHLSLGTFNDIGDSDPEATFGTTAEQLSGQELAYLHLVNPATAELDAGRRPNPRALALLDLMRAKYRGTLMLAGGFDRDCAEAWLEKGRADIIAFGRKFSANPDLPRRLRECAPLNADDTSTYYGGGAKGYTDYPTLEQERGEAPKPCVDDRWR
jgi:N-ethylmaleimide reductase